MCWRVRGTFWDGDVARGVFGGFFKDRDVCWLVRGIFWDGDVARGVFGGFFKGRDVCWRVRATFWDGDVARAVSGAFSRVETCAGRCGPLSGMETSPGTFRGLLQGTRRVPADAGQFKDRDVARDISGALSRIETCALRPTQATSGTGSTSLITLPCGGDVDCRGLCGVNIKVKAVREERRLQRATFAAGPKAGDGQPASKAPRSGAWPW